VRAEVRVGVCVAVGVRVGVCVAVGVRVGVLVGVAVLVAVGTLVGVDVLVAVGTLISAEPRGGGFNLAITSSPQSPATPTPRAVFWTGSASPSALTWAVTTDTTPRPTAIPRIAPNSVARRSSA
jgi:hypothetical protein